MQATMRSRHQIQDPFSTAARMEAERERYAAMAAEKIRAAHGCTSDETREGLIQEAIVQLHGYMPWQWETRAKEALEARHLGAALAEIPDVDLRGGDPCPRCDRSMASCSPSGRGTAACDHCHTVYGETS